MTPVLVPPHSYPVLSLDAKCQMYRRGAEKPDVRHEERKAYCKGTPFSCSPFQVVLSLLFFFALSIFPAGRDSDWKRVGRRKNTAFAAPKSHGSKLFRSQTGLGFH